MRPSVRTTRASEFVTTCTLRGSLRAVDENNNIVIIVEAILVIRLAAVKIAVYEHDT